MATIPALPFSGQNLKDALDEVNTEVGGKAASSHTHTLSQVTDAGTAAASDASDFATAAQGTTADSALQPGDVATVATTGDYADLSGKPTLGSAADNEEGDFATAAQGAKADTAVQPSALAVFIKSDVVQAGGGEAIDNLVVIEQVDYDNIVSPDATTMYFATEA